MSLFVALLHAPVIDRHGMRITASVTNLDLQDIARSSKTFGAERYFVVHPSPDEQALNRRIVGHWKTGYGKTAHPSRSEALDFLQLCSEFSEVESTVEELSGKKPLRIGTTARLQGSKILSISDCRAKIETEPVILVFGTGYGLTEEFLDSLDYLLPPISGPTDFNHLSVRSAVAIYLDRLRGR
ncbi:MAG: hypothetical protein JWQ35_1361 [Bacteriovoracaceae bacterium]|nr:hypothetical protein [Bacteriovoracaceae bacterium]